MKNIGGGEEYYGRSGGERFSTGLRAVRSTCGRWASQPCPVLLLLRHLGTHEALCTPYGVQRVAYVFWSSYGTRGDCAPYQIFQIPIRKSSRDSRDVLLFISCTCAAMLALLWLPKGMYIVRWSFAWLDHEALICTPVEENYSLLWRIFSWPRLFHTGAIAYISKMIRERTQFGQVYIHTYI